MPDINTIFTSDTLKAADLKGRDVALTISSIEIVVYEDNGRKSQKPVISFLETTKTLVSNKTNSMMIADAWGNNTDSWPGNKITIYPTRTSFGDSIVDCIRVRPPITSTQTPSQGLPDTPVPADDNAKNTKQEQSGMVAIDDEIPFAPETRG